MEIQTDKQDGYPRWIFQMDVTYVVPTSQMNTHNPSNVDSHLFPKLWVLTLKPRAKNAGDTVVCQGVGPYRSLKYI